jgi:hypothetical protein
MAIVCVGGALVAAYFPGNTSLMLSCLTVSRWGWPATSWFWFGDKKWLFVVRAIPKHSNGRGWNASPIEFRSQNLSHLGKRTKMNCQYFCAHTLQRKATTRFSARSQKDLSIDTAFGAANRPAAGISSDGATDLSRRRTYRVGPPQVMLAMRASKVDRRWGGRSAGRLQPVRVGPGSNACYLKY